MLSVKRFFIKKTKVPKPRTAFLSICD